MSNHNTSTLKRRRPYGHEDFPAEREFQGPPSHMPSAVDAPAAVYVDDRQYILKQAASLLNLTIHQLVDLSRLPQFHNSPPVPPPPDETTIVQQAALHLQVPVDSLLEFSHQHNQRHQKRPRLNTNPPSTAWEGGSASAHEAMEKLPDSRYISPQAGHPSIDRRPQIVSGPGPFLGLSGSRITECLSNFPICNPCTGFESHADEYQPLPTSGSFDYGSVGNGRPVAVEAVSAAALLAQTTQSPVYSMTATTAPGAGQPGLLGGVQPGMLGPYSMPQHYTPPMTAKVDAGLHQQPTTSGETMYYPVNTLGVAYSSKPMGARGDPLLAKVPPISSDAREEVQIEASQFVQAGGFPASDRMPVEMAASQSPHSAAMVAVIPPRYDMIPATAYGPPALGDGRGLGLGPFGRAHEVDMMGPSSNRAPPAKRGPFKDHTERQKTAYTRKIGSCIRCRMQRIRCHTDPDNDKGTCGTCKKVANANKIWRLPCLRLKINDIMLSKPGQVKGFEWTQRWKDSVVTDEISQWASNEIRTIRVTEGFTGKAVELRVRQFVPQLGDSLERSWMVGGAKRSVKIPPYALVDMDAAKVAYDSYIKTGVLECCKHLLSHKEALLWQTYGLALKMSLDESIDRKERMLICWTLELWVSIRLTTTSFEIVGDETLGMSADIMDETSPLHGKIPLPPVLGAQLDSILIHQIQAKFRHDTLDALQKMTQENKPKTWLATYLATFMLLHNIALVIKHDASYARKHGMKGRFAREDKVKQYYNGAITLLAYFHYRGGNKIFATDFKDDDLRLHVGADRAAFIAYTRRYARDREREWQELVQGDDIEDEFFFVSQLYEQNWMPRSWPCG